MSNQIGKDSIKHMEIWTFDHASLNGGFKIIDVDGFEGPLSSLRVTNDVDVNVMISFDGIYDHDFIQLHDRIEIMPPICSRSSNKKCLFRKGTKVYARLVDNQPKGGQLVVQGFYQE